MSEWEKLWAEEYQYETCEHIIVDMDWLDKVRAVGDENLKLMQLANKRLNELAKMLGEARAENQQLREKLETYQSAYRASIIDQQGYIERLEAVREIVTTDKAVDLVDVTNAIMEVLGGE